MFAIALTGLGEDKYMTVSAINPERQTFPDQETAELVRQLFPETYGAQLVRVNTVTPQDLRGESTSGVFTARRNEETGNWNVWDKKLDKWAGADLTSREQARSLAKILNSQLGL